MRDLSRVTRAQFYLDAKVSPGGGGVKPDGTPTPRVDLVYYLDALGSRDNDLVLDPRSQSRWTIECALRDAFGWDGTKDPQPHHLDRLRALAAEMTYLPPLMVQSVVLVGTHEDCPGPHPSSD